MTNTKSEELYHEIEAVLNNFKNKRYTYSDAIEIVQELIDTAVREREEEIMKLLPFSWQNFLQKKLIQSKKV